MVKLLNDIFFSLSRLVEKSGIWRELGLWDAVGLVVRGGEGRGRGGGEAQFKK
jgi:hypothetical protein